MQRSKDRRVRYFPVREYGSRANAKAAAEKWVRRQLREMPDKLESKGRMTSRNSSGVVGVHRHCQLITKRRGKEHEYFSWVAKWPGCPLRGGVKWPVKTLGEDKAFVLAVLCRRMETTNRRRVFAAFEGIRNKAGFRAILRLRKAA